MGEPASGMPASGIAASGVPARHYKWPPFQPGHRLSMTHGAYSPVELGKEAAAVLEEIADVAPPWLVEVDRFELVAWATAEGACRRLRRWLHEHGDLDDAGKPRAAHDLLIRWERRAADARRRLGFDPLARAQLARDRAAAGLFTVQGQQIAGAERLVQEGRPIVERRLAGSPVIEGESDDDGDR